MSKAKDRGREISFEGRYSRQGVKQPFGYTGYRYDSVGDTYFAQAREYQPAYGRFLAEDIRRGRTAIPKTRNRYGYCWNNPVGMVDLNGMEPELPDMNTLLQQLRPQGESMEPQAPEFVNPFEILGEDRREEPSFPSPQEILDESRGKSVSTEGWYVKGEGVQIYSVMLTVGTGAYSGNGYQYVRDGKGNWDIQEVKSSGVMMGEGKSLLFSYGRLDVPTVEDAAGYGYETGVGGGTGIVGGMNLISAYKDDHIIGDGEMVYVGFGSGLDVHMGGTYAHSVKDEYLEKVEFFLNLFSNKD